MIQSIISLSLSLSLYIYIYIYIHTHTHIFLCVCTHKLSFPGSSTVKHSSAIQETIYNAEDERSFSGSRRSLGGGASNPLRFLAWETP